MGGQLKAIVIGTSAGAVESLSAILPQLPADFPLPVIVVVHLPPDRKSILAGLFDDRCAMHVKEAEDTEPLEAGTIYFAPSDYHLLAEKDGHLSLSSEEPVLYSRPSIDVLFETAADAYGEGLLGIVLSGANEDGAAGLAAILAVGGEGWVQTPATAYASLMPEAALKRNPTAKSMELSQIAHRLKEYKGA
ncbi:MAG: chemotaxis protein CheB [Alphaproteobacteria bacterium]|nr:chemotaxis protein CheB [Alphaproteobacteria bacterium]